MVSTGQYDLDPAHARAVALVGFVAGGLAFICMELVRWRYQTQLTAAGFTPWGSGFYIREIAGQSLTLTRLQMQLMILVACLPAGLAASLLCAVAAMMDMHMPFKTVSAATLPIFLLLPASGALVYFIMQPASSLTVDISHGMVSVARDQTGFPLGSLAQFDSYMEGSGKGRHMVLGATLTTGAQVDLLPLPRTVDGAYLAQALQGFVSSGGTVFPAG